MSQRVVVFCALVLLASAHTAGAQAPGASPGDSVRAPNVAGPRRDAGNHAGANEPRRDPEGPLERIARSVSASGFLVAQSTARSAPGELLSLTTVELDGTIELGERLQAAVSVVHADNAVELPVGFIDVHFGGAHIAPRGQIFAERGVHLQAGRFDLPFGADWQRFASTDRGLSSAPSITDVMNDGGLNDVGVRAYSVTARWNASAWLVRGALGHRAGGARVALTPFSNPFVFPAPLSDRPVELGVSTHVDAGDEGIADQRVALDLALRRGDLTVDAEWQERRALRAVQDLVPGRARGWHLSAEMPVPSVGPVGGLLLARIEGVRGDALGTEGLADATFARRAAAGTRIAVGSWLLVKCELGWRLGARTDDGSPARAWLLDAVVRW